MSRQEKSTLFYKNTIQKLALRLKFQILEFPLY